MRSLTVLFFCAALFGRPFCASAWDVMLEPAASLPAEFIAVDKGCREFRIMQNDDSLVADERVPVIYGKKEGDKQRVKDLRTPEGVYFIEGKIPYALDFMEYGSQAFALNYPNPVDRLRGKTGSGIWLHSKGQPIERVRTRGCIAIELHDIDRLAPRFVTGMPLLVAQNIVQPIVDCADMPEAATPAALNAELLAADRPELSPATAGALLQRREVLRLSAAWNEAWEARSGEMFDFYNPAAYSRTTQHFASFRAQKEQIFRSGEALHIEQGKINVLPGTGYWVSWFTQHYSSGNYHSEGMRRLYWMPDEDGQLKIVAMEWIPQNSAMHKTL